MITGWCPQTSSAPHEQRIGCVNHHGKDAFHERTEKHFFSQFLDSLSRKLPFFKCLHCVILAIVQYGMDPRRGCWVMLRVAAPSEHLGGFCICSVQISTLTATVCAGEAQFLMESKANSEKKLLSFLLSFLHLDFSLNKTALIYPMQMNG